MVHQDWERFADTAYPVLAAACADLVLPGDARVADVLGDGRYFVVTWVDEDGERLVREAVAEGTEADGCVEYDAVRKMIREYCVPRGVAFFAGDDVSFYEYGGGKTPAQHLSKFPRVAALLAHVNAKYAGTQAYTATLLNVYRTLHDKIDMHSDRDVAPDEAVGVVCATVGAPRDLVFRKKPQKGDDKGEKLPMLRVTKEDGMFLAMVGPGFQDAIQHGIARRSDSGEASTWSASFTMRRHHAKPAKPAKPAKRKRA